MKYVFLISLVGLLLVGCMNDYESCRADCYDGLYAHSLGCSRFLTSSLQCPSSINQTLLQNVSDYCRIQCTDNNHYTKVKQ